MGQGQRKLLKLGVWLVVFTLRCLFFLRIKKKKNVSAIYLKHPEYACVKMAIFFHSKIAYSQVFHRKLKFSIFSAKLCKIVFFFLFFSIVKGRTTGTFYINKKRRPIPLLLYQNLKNHNTYIATISGGCKQCKYPSSVGVLCTNYLLQKRVKNVKRCCLCNRL